ncbi:hypothetical protein [Dyadobacter sp.]|uniref:hypothetical protein n=1 Tax=Dyadobacter sp. TaxID=1914288 RepID=UPI003265DE15
MKYKYISTKGSALQMRLIICFLAIFGLGLATSYFWDDEKYVVKLFLGSIVLLTTYPLSRFSTVKYNSSEIVIQSIMGETHYSKNELLTIRPLRPYLNLYKIVFNDKKSYVFGLPSSRIFLTNFANEDAAEMEKELLETKSSS